MAQAAGDGVALHFLDDHMALDVGAFALHEDDGVQAGFGRDDLGGDLGADGDGDGRLAQTVDHGGDEAVLAELLARGLAQGFALADDDDFFGHGFLLPGAARIFRRALSLGASPHGRQKG